MSNPNFWVFASLVGFLAIVWRVGGFKAILGSLDDRASRIRAELGEATRLREEAQGLLADYERRRTEAEGEAAGIVAAARAEAERMGAEAETKMADFIRRRTATAEAKIAQAETQAMAEVRAAAADAAVRASETVLREQMRAGGAEALLTRSLAETSAKLQ